MQGEPYRVPISQDGESREQTLLDPVISIAVMWQLSFICRSVGSVVNGEGKDLQILFVHFFCLFVFKVLLPGLLEQVCATRPRSQTSILKPV